MIEVVLNTIRRPSVGYDQAVGRERAQEVLELRFPVLIFAVSFPSTKSRSNTK